MRVGVGAVLVERELDLEIGFGVPQIDQREAVEVEPVGDIEAQCGAVEGDRPVQIQDPDHHVNGLGHVRAPASPRSYQAPGPPGSTCLLPKEGLGFERAAAAGWRTDGNEAAPAGRGARGGGRGAMAPT